MRFYVTDKKMHELFLKGVDIDQYIQSQVEWLWVLSEGQSYDIEMTYDPIKKRTEVIVKSKGLPTSDDDPNPRKILTDLIPQLDDYRIECPHPGECLYRQMYPNGKVSLGILIIHLNDTHTWTREQIADWLETLDIDLGFKVG